MLFLVFWIAGAKTVGPILSEAGYGWVMYVLLLPGFATIYLLDSWLRERAAKKMKRKTRQRETD